MTPFSFHPTPANKSPTSTVTGHGMGNGQPGGDGFNSLPSTPPRTFCNATTQGLYTGPVWSMRAGSDRAAAIPSRGTGC